MILEVLWPKLEKLLCTEFYSLCALLCAEGGGDYSGRLTGGWLVIYVGSLLCSGQFCSKVHLCTCSAAMVPVQTDPLKSACLQLVLLFANEA